jgi:hypothetical protein
MMVEKDLRVSSTPCSKAGLDFFRDRVSLYCPGCHGTQSVGQASLELTNLPASASQVRKLEVCATALDYTTFFNRII